MCTDEKQLMAMMHGIAQANHVQLILSVSIRVNTWLIIVR